MKAKTTNGLGIMHITKGAIESWESTFPGTAEQREIAERLMNLDGAICTEVRKLELFTRHKKGLMQRLFPSIDDIEI
jgi:type I restriction enzyme S subunit